jgi:malonyl-CoA/methylmalonyl-CoA synthetase
MNHNLYAELARAATDAAAPFAHLSGGRTQTYADVEATSARYAATLARLGVVPGDRVAVQVEKSFDALMLYLGVVRAGGVFLPLNTAYTPAEIEYFLGDAEPRVFVCDPARADALRPIAGKAGAHLETLGAAAATGAATGSLPLLANAATTTFTTIERGEDDLAAILYTSGTTGRSKGAMLTHRNLVSNARALIETWRFSRRDVLLHALPIFHTHGLFVATNVVLFSGASMHLLARFDIEEVFSALPHVTTMMGVPTFYTRLLQDERLTAAACAHMRLFVSGSAPLLAETHRAWRARTGHAILERYGMTETNMLTSNPYTGERIAGSVGLPLPGVEVRIADPDTGSPIAAGEVGMIEVRGPNVFKGYWRMPEKTRAEFRADGFFITGDLGRIDPNGYVSIVGRGKDLVITGGYNVYPKEVEAEIDEIEGVVESAVIGVPHPDFGEAVTAVVVKDRSSRLGEREVIRALEGRLAKFKCPKRVMFVEALPRNTMGKVLKNELRETHKDLFAPRGAG